LKSAHFAETESISLKMSREVGAKIKISREAVGVSEKDLEDFEFAAFA